MHIFFVEIISVFEVLPLFTQVSQRNAHDTGSFVKWVVHKIFRKHQLQLNIFLSFKANSVYRGKNSVRSTSKPVRKIFLKHAFSQRKNFIFAQKGDKQLEAELNDQFGPNAFDETSQWIENIHYILTKCKKNPI